MGSSSLNTPSKHEIRISNSETNSNSEIQLIQTSQDHAFRLARVRATADNTNPESRCGHPFVFKMDSRFRVCRSIPFTRHPERQRRISSRLRLTDKRSFAGAQDDDRRLPEYFDKPENGNPSSVRSNGLTHELWKTASRAFTKGAIASVQSRRQGEAIANRFPRFTIRVSNLFRISRFGFRISSYRCRYSV